MSNEAPAQELLDHLHSSNELLSPKIDFVFKLLFGTEENKELLTQFLKATLDIPPEEYEEVILQNPVLPKETADDKYGIGDITLKTKSGSLINIEIHVLDMPHYKSRILYYVSKMLSEHIKSDEQYAQIAKTISISILNFNLIKDSSTYHNVYHLYDKKTNSIFTELLEVVILELPKLPKESDGTTIFPWLKFLDIRDKENAMTTVEHYPELKPAYDELQKIRLDTTKQSEYDQRLKWYLDAVNMREGSREEGIKLGMEKGLQKGLRQGLQEGKRDGLQQGKKEGLQKGKKEGLQEGEHNKACETALKLRKMGLTTEQIHEATGLSIEEIRIL